MELTPKFSFIYGAARTPIGTFRGALTSVPAPELGAVALNAALRQSGVSAERIDEVLMGNVIGAGLGQAPARQAALQAGIPESVPATLVNKVCASGMKTVMMADQAVRLDAGTFFLAGGMENMSRAPFLLPEHRTGHRFGDDTLIDSLIHDGLLDATHQAPMGELTERTVRDFGFSRKEQDAYAQESYTRAQRAIEQGLFDAEVVPVIRSGAELEFDEQPFNGNLDQLSVYSPAFDKERGTITKMNGAKISDGGAALIIGREDLNLNPLARIVGHATHAQSPETFCLAPIEAIRKVLSQNKMTIESIDLFEINEAFAAASLAVHRELGLDPERVNVHGGAIALGHPIGATGARILVTLIHALRRHGLKRGLAGLCVGGGEATAIIVELA